MDQSLGAVMWEVLHRIPGSAYQLARASGVSFKSISCARRGEGNLDHSELVKLVEVLRWWSRECDQAADLFEQFDQQRERKR